MCHTYRCPHMDALHPHLSSGNDSVSKLKMATKCTAKASGKVYDYRRTAPSLYLPPLAVTLFLDWEYQQGNLQTVNSFPIPAARCISLLAKSDAMGCDAKQMEMQMQIHLDAMQTGAERKSDTQKPKDAKRVHQWASAMLSSWVCTGHAIC